MTGVHWAPAQIAELRQLKQEKRSYPQIAAILGRSREAVAGKLRRLKRDPDHIRPSCWADPANVAELQRLCVAGLSNTQIAAALGSTVDAVRNKLWRLKPGCRGGYAGPGHGRRMVVDRPSPSMPRLKFMEGARV